MKFLAGLVSAVALAAAAPSAFAQKAKDTVRIGAAQPISVIDAVYDPQPQTNLMDRMVFDCLVNYDSDKREIIPGLAESWKLIDGRIYEFKLRQGIKFHDGSPFTADDVVYTVAHVIDPNSRFRFKETRYGMIEKAEKVDDFTVRIVLKEPTAPFLSRITTSLPIYPHKVHGALADKSTFGRKPVGTGPYKAIQVDSTRGIILVRNDDYKHGNAGKPAAKIGRIEMIPVPDQQTQVARMMVGEQDLMYDVPAEIAEQLKANPSLEISVRPSVSFSYIALDAANRTKSSPFVDKRVREAVLHAIDRRAITKALQPAEIAAMPLQRSMCHEWHIGCTATLDPPEFNLDKARALMKEAGHEKGFKLVITTWGPSRAVTEAVSAQLRRINIDVSIDSQTVPGFVKKREAGELPAYIVLWDNGGGNPDVESTTGFFFEPGARNYNGDKELSDLHHKGQVTLDQKERDAIYKRLFDKATAERYAMPIMPLASVIAHAKDLKIPVGGTKKPEGFMFNLLEWK